MAYKDTIDSLKSAVQGRIAELAKNKEAMEAQLANLESLESDFEDKLQEEKKISRDEGFDEGVLQNAKAGDKQFSLEELNEEIKPRDAKIAELTSKQEPLEAKVEELTKQNDQQTADLKAAQTQVEALDEKIKTGVEQGIAAYKTELRSKYEEQQVAEQQGETGFADLLK